MGVRTGLLIRVIWDGATVEERAFFDGDEVRVGAGPEATAVAPSQSGQYARFRRVPEGVELNIDPGAAEHLSLEGEPARELAGLAEPLRLRIPLPLAFGVLRIGGARVEFEPVSLEREAVDRELWAAALAALLVALFAGGSYRVVRVLADGWRHPDESTRLSNEQAAVLRVRIGPDGEGSSRPQAGAGSSLHGMTFPEPPVTRRPPGSDAENPLGGLVPDSMLIPLAHETHKPNKRRHPRKVMARPALSDEPEAIERSAEPQPQVPPDSTAGAPPDKEPENYDRAVDRAEAALLDADLPSAIDGFSRAAEKSELSYEQVTLLGLAHYLEGSLDEAERAWQKARELQPESPEPLVNLAHVARRRGDTAGELKLLGQALALSPRDCKALNNQALAFARNGESAASTDTQTLAKNACGDAYPYATIHHAAILALAGQRTAALDELGRGLATVDTLLPVKEFEVYADLTVDPAFAPLRADARFRSLVERYLPRAAKKGITPPRRSPAPDLPLDAHATRTP